MSSRKRAATHYSQDRHLLEEGDMGDKKELETNIKGDEKSIAILFFLYLLQGIPLGLTSAIPMYLQNRGVSYKQQVSTTICSMFEQNILTLNTTDKSCKYNIFEQT